MTATLFSLIALVVAFTGMVVWVLRPSNHERWEQASRLPFETDSSVGASDE